MKEEQKKILVFAGALLGAYALYKLLVDKKSPTKAVSESVEVVTDTAKKVVKKAAYLIKGSPEAKAHMKKLASMRGKNKKKTKAITDEQIIKKHKLKGKAASAVRSGKVIKKKKIGREAMRNKISKEKFSKPFSEISMAQAQIVNSELSSRGYKLDIDKIPKKEVDKEIKKMRKEEKKKIRGGAGGKATAAKGPHKGHKTKKGLSQDQKRISKEKHEKQYQKKKK